MSTQYPLSQKEFDLFRSLIYDEFGISLSDRKKSLLQARLRKWIERFGYSSYKELYEHFRSDGSTLFLLADAITTNVTSFFREANQWEYLKESFLPTLQSRKIRIWSAGCSSGQEPYTVAIFLMENLPQPHSWDIKILASDLSNEILTKAMKGQYTAKEMDGLSKTQIQKYFHQNGNYGQEKTYTVNEDIKSMILFRSFNLVTGNYAMFKNRFNLIFCRNVMIYFDKNTQLQVVNHLKDLLYPESLLLLGHSESITQTIKNLKMIGSSIYVKHGKG